MRTTVLFTFALVSALTACSKAPAPEPIKGEKATETAARGVKQASVTTIRPLATKKFGAEITEKDSTLLPALVKEPAKFISKTVRTEGTVSAVCEEMGCWMQITDTAGQAHIKMAGHSFFIPKEANGHRAVVQGKVLNIEANKGHCEAEAEAQTGQVAKVEIEATGVQFVD